MSIVSHLHHLFTPETCQAYIHTLRWKDRPLQCPRCQSLNVGPWTCQPSLNNFLPHLHDRLTANPARIIVRTIPQHGHQDTQQSVANTA